jgi:MFS family permease
VIVLAFGFLNAAQVGAINVLGPVVAKAELGGASAYGAIFAAQALGLLLGALVTLRFKPSRPLFVGCAAIIALPPVMILLALGAPLALILLAALVAGVGMELFGVYWDTALQQHIPERALSRVSSYDALGSFIFIPLGQLAAGPIAEAIGVDQALYLAAAVVTVAVLAMVATPDIRNLRRVEPVAAERGQQ